MFQVVIDKTRHVIETENDVYIIVDNSQLKNKDEVILDFLTVSNPDR